MKKLFLFLLFFAFTTSFLSAMDEKKHESNSLKIRHIFSNKDHIEHLRWVLNTARKSVMISSYDISLKTLFEENILLDIKNAQYRDVKVYIYYKNLTCGYKKGFNDSSVVSKYCEIFEQMATHSKFVINDGINISIGSYNWLGSKKEESFNSSVVISGKDTDKNMIEIISDIWVNIPYYTNLKTKYTYITEKFLNYKENFLLEPREFSPGQYLYALRTPEAHSVFLNDFFKNAKTNIVMISPFIRLDKLKKIFEDSILDDFEKRGVNVTLVTLYFPCSNHEERKEIFSQLMTLKKKYPRFSYITQSNVHAKTLISDDWICEGSFNWLSAVEDIQHKAHNFEFSLGIKGDAAKNLIESFYKTEIGKTILLGTTKAVIQKKRVIRQNTFPMIKEDSESSKKMRGENFTPSSIQPTFNFPSEPNNRIHLSPSNNIIFPSNSNNILPSLSPESVSTESKLPN